MKRITSSPLVAVAALSLVVLGGCGGVSTTDSAVTPGTGSGQEDAATVGSGRTPVSEPTFIQVGKEPEGIAYAKGAVYVANAAGNSVSVVGTTRNETVATITGVEQPMSVVAAPDETKVYVSVSGKKPVVEIDTKSNKVVRRLPGNGGELAISPDGRWLYQSPGGAGVSRTDLRSGTTRELPGTDRTTVFAVSRDGAILFGQRVDSDESGNAHPQLVRLTAADGKLDRETRLVADTLWSFAGDMIFDPDFGYLYVSMLGMNNGFTGYSGTTVQRYDPATLEMKGVYAAGRDREINVELGPTGLAFPKEQWQTRLAVANSNSGLGLINLDSGETTERGSIGTPEKSPSHAAFTPDGKGLYLTNTGFGQSEPPTIISFFKVGAGS